MWTIKKWQRCSVIAAGSKKANLYLIGCISDRGIVHHLILRGSFNHNLANDYVWAALRKAVEMFEDRLFLWSITLHATPDLKKLREKKSLFLTQFCILVHVVQCWTQLSMLEGLINLLWKLFSLLKCRLFWPMKDADFKINPISAWYGWEK